MHSKSSAPSCRIDHHEDTQIRWTGATRSDKRLSAWSANGSWVTDSLNHFAVRDRADGFRPMPLSTRACDVAANKRARPPARLPAAGIDYAHVARRPPY